MTGEAAPDGLIAAVGNFDGVHLGHQALIQHTVERARAQGRRPGVVVFDPHPRRFFAPDTPPFLITSPAERLRLLQEAGAHEVLTLAFDAGLAATSPRAFVETVLRDRLRLAGVMTGAEFRFGKGRTGDAAELARLCAEAGLVYEAVAPVSAADRKDKVGDKVGSSAVREAIAKGDMRAARALLGRSWRVVGPVEEGRRLGRSLGFPTANLSLGELIEPQYGVYAIFVTVGGERRPGVANFGRRPTVAGGETPRLEAHIFDFDAAIYGQPIAVDFVDFIRSEMTFESLDALKARIATDATEARRRLSQAV